MSGFYSEWSPSITAYSIKVLAAEKEQDVVTDKGCEIDPPRLGSVGEFSLKFTQRHKLNPKQDLRGINVDKLFEKSYDDEEGLAAEKKNQDFKGDKDALMLSQLARNEEALKKLSIPIWFIFIALCYLLIKFTH